MVSKIICAWLFISTVVVINGANEPKRDKRTVDLLLRGAADLFGYDVVRRITVPTLRQVAAPRPTFFPPPVAPQLPPGTYSRVILSLGQQQQLQQQQLQEQFAQALRIPPLAQPQQVSPQQAFINIPQSGSLTANAQSITIPSGSLLPAAQFIHVPVIPQILAPVAVQAVAAPPQQAAAPAAQQAAAPAPQQAPPPTQQAAPAPQASSAPQQAPPAPQQPQQAPPSSAPQNAQQIPAPQDVSIQGLSGIPLQIVAIAPANSLTQGGGQGSQQQQNPPQQQQNPPQQQQNTPPQQQNAQQGAPAQPSQAAPAAGGAGPQQQGPGNGINLVFDQGPTRWNLFSLPRQEAVRRTLNFNLNWNRNVEPAAPAQLQLVPIPLPTDPTPPLQQQASQQQPQQQQPQQQQQTQQQQPQQQPPPQEAQQQLPPPTPTIENFEINPATNSAFNRYYNVPDSFEAKSAAQRQKEENAKFRESIKQFWNSSPWNIKNNDNNLRSENLQEEITPQYEEYNLESNTEEVNPQSEQYQEEINEVEVPAAELNDENGNKTRNRRFRLNADRIDEESRESSNAPKFRRRNKIRRIRKVKKTLDDSDETKSNLQRSYVREKKSPSEMENNDVEVKNYYKKFTVPLSEQATSN